MKPGVPRRFAFLVGGLFVAGLMLRVPALAAGYLTNAAMLGVAAAPACDPAWYVCRHTSQALWYPPQRLAANGQTLEAALGLVRQAAALEPAKRRAALHEAELLFALGERADAAAVMTEAGWPVGPEPDPLSNSLTWPAGSPLVTLDRYENRLIRAHQQAAAGRWAEAVTEYRLGLAVAGERATPQDWREFYVATAEWRAGQAQAEPGRRWLAGKYLSLAGEWPRAIEFLEPVVAGAGDLPAADRAWAAYYLGRAYEGLGDEPAALNAYRAGWLVAPEVRQNGIQLVRLLQPVDSAQAAEIVQALEANGPAFLHGRSAPDYRFDVTAALPSGWAFAGYDLDPETLEHGGPLEAWLWWRPPAPGGFVGAGEDGLSLGVYAVQRQQLVNLIANGGFEWGVRYDGVPLGWRNRIYSVAAEALYVAETPRGGRTTRAAVGDNQDDISSGLEGNLQPVETEGWYLMAGSMRQAKADNSNIGRICAGPSFQAKGPYFAPWPPQVLDNAWVQIADVAPAYPADQPDRCHIILINYENPGGQTMWDDLLLARIVPPAAALSP